MRPRHPSWTPQPIALCLAVFVQGADAVRLRLGGGARGLPGEWVGGLEGCWVSAERLETCDQLTALLLLEHNSFHEPYGVMTASRLLDSCNSL